MKNAFPPLNLKNARPGNTGLDFVPAKIVEQQKKDKENVDAGVALAMMPEKQMVMQERPRDVNVMQDKNKNEMNKQNQNDKSVAAL